MDAAREGTVSDLIFYTNPMSRGRIVRWMLEELGVPYDLVVLNYGDEMRAPEYLGVNPMGKVPAILHGETVVTEAAAICSYLAEAFPEAGLAPPPGSPARGTFLRWMFFGAGPVEAAITNAAFGWAASDPQEEARLGYGSMDRVAKVLSDRVAEGPYLMGERFSALDVYLGSQILWGRMLGALPEREPLDAYVARIEQRPAAVRARQLDDALLPADADP
jgi:glutathione S-transferase